MGSPAQFKECFVCYRESEDHVEISACSSCTTAYVNADMKHRVLPTDYLEGTMCAICVVQQADPGKLFSRFHICANCIMDSVDNFRRNVEAPRLAFLQQSDPSPGDICFVVKGSEEEIRAHRYVLASKSPVFKAMMENNMKENLTATIQIEDMSATVVQAAVKFMYMGYMEFNNEVLPQDVLRFAHQYDIQYLRDFCDFELSKKVTQENLSEMLSISYRFGARMLKARAAKYLRDHPLVLGTFLDAIYD